MWKADPFDDLASDRRYVSLHAHARAKLLMVLATLALARRQPSMRVNAVNPGMAWTPGIEALTPEAVPVWGFAWPIVRWFQRRAPAERAARGPIFLASAEEVTFSGRYLDEMKEKPLPQAIFHRDNQERAWRLAGEMLAAGAGGLRAAG